MKLTNFEIIKIRSSSLFEINERLTNDSYNIFLKEKVILYWAVVDKLCEIYRCGNQCIGVQTICYQNCLYVIFCIKYSAE